MFAFLIRCGGLDAGVSASLVGVLVRGGRVVIDDLDRLDIHREGTSGVVSLASSPPNGTFRIVGVAASPDTDLNTHWGLGVVLAVQGIGVLESAGDLAVQDPLDAVGGPVDGVGVEGLLGGSHVDSGGAVVGSCIAFAEVVSLDRRVVSADLFLFRVSHD